MRKVFNLDLLKHIRDAGGLGRGIPFLADSFFSRRILEACGSS
jgi:hypothetical protein